MNTKNNTILAEIMRKLSPLFTTVPIANLSSDFIWNMILGVFPNDEILIVQNKKDSTADKIENIGQLTIYVEYFVDEKPDFCYQNIKSFTLALNQLLKYTSGDSNAENSLNRLKTIYISFISTYYIISLKKGEYKSSTNNIRYLSEIIYDDKSLRSRLNEIILTLN